jgi:hypothetical protein
MTRGELVAELLGLWRKSAERLRAEKNTLAACEVETAIDVLSRTYTAQELAGNAQNG